MKFLVNIVLFIFITFLSTPTLVGMIDDKVDTSYFYSMCEEEENHAPFNEIKSIPSNHYSLLNIDLEESKAFLQKHPDLHVMLLFADENNKMQEFKTENFKAFLVN